MNALITVILTFYLIYSSYTDLKRYTISTPVSVITGILIVILQISSNVHAFDILLSIVPGIFLLFIAFVTGQSIGYGDGIVFLIVGTGMGFKQTLLLLFLAFILSALFSLYLITRHKSGKYTLPFVPFILSSYVLNFFLNI